MRYRLIASCLFLTTLSLTGALASDGSQTASPQDLQSKRQELGDLRSQAEQVTKQISELTASGKLPTNDDSIALLKKMVDELSAINQKLKSLEDSITLMQTGKAPKAPAAQPSPPSKLTWSGYLQFQYFDTDRKGSPQFDAFRIRRARVNLDGSVDPRTSFRASLELASATGNNEARLRDAYIAYDFSRNAGDKITRGIAGQQNMPLGYEILRADTDREFPERAVYNTTMFSGERGRGVQVRHMLGNGWEVFGGLFNSLTIDDPEQVNSAAGTGNTLAGVGGVRKNGSNYSAGISGMVGHRPEYVTGGTSSPNTNRQFLYGDLELRNVLPKLTLRGEAMLGHDRVPKATAVTGAGDHPLSGFQAQARYDFDPANALALRWEQFDPNLSSGGNLLNGFGLAYIHQFSPSLKLTLAHELYTDESRVTSFDQRHYGQTTLRLQIRF